MIENPAALKRLDEAIAILGIGCMLPGGVRGPGAFWRALHAGADLLDGERPSNGAVVGRGRLAASDHFDHRFFDIPRAEAKALDPQQRLLLEVTWQACEDAGLPLERRERVNAGVFVALHSDDYRVLRARDGFVDLTGQVGTARGGAAGRLSHAFKFSGPSLTVDSDRSSALTAVHLACQALRDGECEIAVVGAANLILLDDVTRAFAGAGLLAADGRCKFADASADGFTRSEAVVAVVLSRLEYAARHEPKRVYALIRGSAVRHGGGEVPSFTAPGALAHEEAIREALARAGVQGSDVAYVEAHGTGTPVGDPIELDVIAKVVGGGREPNDPCLVGSVKTNLGHTEAAAGLVGLVKTALAIHHGRVPPSLHYESSSPERSLARLGLAIPTESRAWPETRQPRIAGVSAIGLTGTVAHVTLGQAASAPEPHRDSPRRLVLPLSAHTPTSLRHLTQAWAERLESDGIDAASLARAAGQRLTQHAERVGVSGGSAQDLAAGLRKFAAGELCPSAHRGRASTSSRAVFVFSGHGSQWLGMGRALLKEPVFQAVVEECDAWIRQREGWSVIEELLAERDRPSFRDTATIQPLLVVFQIALAALWRHWGFEPAAVVGASMGEVSAAYVAGALKLEDALELICCRSRLLRTTTGQGRLVIVECTPEEALTAIRGHEHLVSISGFNSPRSILFGGEASALTKVVAPFEQAGVFCRYVNIDGTSHCPQVEGIAGELRERLAHLQPRAEQIPFYSTVAGSRLAGTELTAAYWRRNLREPIQLMQVLAQLTAAGHRTFLEVSPHPMLWSSIIDNLAHLGVAGVAIKSLKRDEDEHSSLMDSVAALYAAGVCGNWQRFQGIGPVATDTPLYPFDGEPLWFSDDPNAGRHHDNTRALESTAGEAPPADRESPALDANRTIATSAEWRERLRLLIARALDVPVDGLATDVAFRELGLTSLMLTEIRASLGGFLGQPVSPSVFFDNPSIDQLSTWLTRPVDAPAAPPARAEAPERRSPDGSDFEAIAVVGMACRFPGAQNIDQFWSLLESGTDAVGEIPSSRWDVDALFDADAQAEGKMYSRWAGLVEDVDKFDAAFFGISAREAEAMDPQQRFLLETTWTALEHAGICPRDLAGTRSAVFVGMSTTGDYATLKADTPMGAHDSTGNAPSIAAGRLSYFLGLEGPCLTVDTACSSSLVAAHLAMRSLRAHESELAIVAGVNLILSPDTSIAYCKTRMLSPRGRCRTFDASADGYVRGEGCGALVLKRLEDARRDGDTIHAVLRGSAINQDGKSNGLTAPNGRAQRSVIAAALTDAAVSPDRLSYLEAHGTGTPLGDPIELEAAGAVLGGTRSVDRQLFVGSVKTNIGHLEAAAGIAGLIKVVLSMRHRLIPPHLHLAQLNPALNLAASGLSVPTVPTAWRGVDGSLLAGVSSFGFSGTNAHVIVESFDAAPSLTSALEAALIVPIAARTPEALAQLAARHSEALRELDDEAFADHALTTATRRTPFDHRAAVVAASAEEAATLLEVTASGRRVVGVARGTASAEKPAQVAFLFTGQGSHYDGMAQDLYETADVFRSEIDRYSDIAKAELGRSIREILFGADRHLLAQTAYAQPASVALQCALVAQWRAWGVEPQAVLGHSLGEYSACVTAGTLSPEDAMHLVVQRGRLMGNLAAPGAAAVAQVDVVRAEQLLARYRGEAGIAAYNAAESVLIGGAAHAVDAVVQAMNAEGINARIVPGLIGVHSAMMDPILDELQHSGEGIAFLAPRMTIVSGLEGREISEAELSDSSYWRRHARNPVRYADAIRRLLALGFDTFVEIGPRHTLVRLGQANAPEGSSAAWLASLSKERHDRRQMLESAAELFVRGVELDWPAIHRREMRFPVSVPTYPFARDRHWVAPRAVGLPRRAAARAAGDSWLGERLRSPLPEQQFEAVVSDAQPSFSGHQLFGKVVVPAAAYVSRVVEAASSLGVTALEFGDLLFSRPLLPTSSGSFSHLVLKPNESGWNFEITSRKAGEDSGAWVLHASGTVRGLEAAPATASDVRLDADSLQDGSLFYRAHAALGYDLSPDFRWLERVWSQPAERIGELRPLETAGSSGLPAGWLDSCLQLAAHLGEEHGLSQDEIWMPIAIDTVRLRPLPRDEKLLCRARLAGVGKDDLIAQVMVVAGGATVMELEGVRLKKVPRARIVGNEPQRVATDAYQLEWAAAEPAAAEQAATEVRREGWIVLSRGDELGAALASELENLGEELAVVTPGETFRVRGKDYELAPERLHEYRRLLADALQRFPKCRGIIHLWGAGPDHDWTGLDGSALEREQQLGVASLIGVARALTELRLEDPPKIWGVTRAAQSVSADDPAGGLLGAPVWGAGRVLAREHAELWGGLIDLGTDDATKAAERLIDEIWSMSRTPEVALRDGKRLVPRLVPRSLTASVRLDPASTYLVTGGLGPLGLHVARLLVERGARRLVLASRSVPKSIDADIRELQESGTTVLTAPLDVTDEESLAALFDRLEKTGNPIRGIVHAAGVLDDAPALELDPERVARVMAPKALGALALHRVVGSRPLDFFVLFSSVAGLIGNEGQLAYAAGNAFLDCFAQQRARRGLPTTSVSWGPWQGAGMAEHSAEQLHRRWGLVALEPRKAVEFLGRVLDGEHAHVTVLAVDAEQVQARADGTLLGSIAPKRAPQSSVHGVTPDALKNVFAAPPHARRERLARHVKSMLAEVLGTAALADASEHQRLEDLGMDSLLAMDLARALQSSLKMTLPSRLLFDHPTAGALIGYLARALRLGDTEPAAETASAASPSA